MDAPPQPQPHGDVHGVYGVQADALAGEGSPQGSGQTGLQFLVLPHAVEQEDPALADAAEQIVLVNIGLVMAGDEIRPLNKV